MSEQPRCLNCLSPFPDPSPRSSRVLELLPERNEVPAFHDDAERIRFLVLRTTLARETESIEAQLENMQEEYKRLLIRKATILRDQVDLGLIFEPIRRLPTEILQKIFTTARNDLAVQPDAYAPAFVRDSLPEKSFNSAPWNASQVCRRWREVSIGYPHLWSYFGIDLKARTQRPSDSFLYLAAVQLARARGCDLHFSLQCNIATAWMLPSIIPYCVISASIWKCLELTVPNFALLDTFFIFAPMLNSLESLHIQVHDRDPSEIGSTVFQAAAHLKEVIGSAYDISRLGLPWTQIERLIFKPSTVHQSGSVWDSESLGMLWRKIELSPLQILVIRQGSSRQLWRDNPQEPNILISLQTLAADTYAVRLILGQLVAPRLRFLHCAHIAGMNEMTIVAQFILRSQIESLRLTFEVKHLKSSSQSPARGRSNLTGTLREDPIEHPILPLQSVANVSQIQRSPAGPRIFHIECLVDRTSTLGGPQLDSNQSPPRVLIRPNT